MLVGWLVRKAIHDLLAMRAEDAEGFFSTVSERLVQVAQSQIGLGEVEANNAGTSVAKFKGLADVTPGRDLGSWCASFASWCMIEAGFWPTLYGIDLSAWNRKRHGARWLFSFVARIGTRVAVPARGDLLLWDRGEEGSWKAHTGLTILREKQWVHYVDGNAGPFPSPVARRIMNLDKPPLRYIGAARLP